MKKQLAYSSCILGILVLLCGCTTFGRTSAQAAGENPLAALDISSYRQNVFLGLSGPYSTQEEMVRQAITNCARNILIADAIALDSRIVSQWGTEKKYKAFAVDDHVYFDDTLLVETIERLQILSVEFDEKAGAIVIARDPARKGTKRPYQSSYDDEGKPTWLKTYPKVEGYRFGIGSSLSYYFLNDSLEAADFSSAQNLLDLGSDFTYSKAVLDVQGESMNQALYQNSRGLLQGFSIVSRYYDEETDTYWSLASIQL
jgi:hypothetical protein